MRKLKFKRYTIKDIEMKKAVYNLFFSFLIFDLHKEINLDFLVSLPSKCSEFDFQSNGTALESVQLLTDT